MDASLVSALQDVKLEPGHTYRGRVRDLWVEVRVTSIPQEVRPAPLSESDIMLDPWTDLPSPQPSVTIRPTHHSRPLPDIPEIPRGA